MNILPIDELNTFIYRFTAQYEQKKRLPDEEDIIDELLDLYLLAYASGAEAAKIDLSVTIAPDAKTAQDAIYAPVAGETWEDRVKKYAREGGTPADIFRIAETDMTRIYNTAALDTVKANGIENVTYKRWNTMLDDKVRDTHSYLEGVIVPYDAEFYTYDGDRARAPGLFALAENNVNCRCVIELTRG